MNKKLISAIKYILFLGFALVLLFFALRNISLQTLLSELKRTDYFLLFLSLLTAILSHFARAYRWTLLTQPLGFKPSVLNTFYAVMVGYFANLALPRMGEVTRCIMLKKTDNIPVDASFGTVVSERIIDLMVLIFLILLNLVLDEKLFGFLYAQFGDKISFIFGNIYVLVLIGFAFIAAAFLIYKNREALQKNLLYIKIINLVGGFSKGLLSVVSIKNKMAFAASTLVIWFLYWLMMHFAVMSYPECSSFNFVQTYTIMIVGGLAMAAPVQGGIGAFHLLISNLVLLYGINNTSGIVLATILHSAQMLMIIVVGALSLGLILIKESKQKRANI